MRVFIKYEARPDLEKTEMMGRMPIALWALYRNYFFGSKLKQVRNKIILNGTKLVYWLVEP